MYDNPLIQYLKELCLFLDDAGIEYMLVGRSCHRKWETLPYD